MSDTVKAWLPPSDKGVRSGSVDGKKLGYGKKAAIALTPAQVKRLRETGLEVETESTDKPKTKSKKTTSS